MRGKGREWKAKEEGGGAVWQQGGRGTKGRWEEQLPACAYHQISLMKWVKIVKPSGPGATDILSYAPPTISTIS